MHLSMPFGKRSRLVHFQVVGFPRGGRQVCMTKGVVSRVTSKGFAIDHFPSPSQLAIQIDAAINPGNSGGPALYVNIRACLLVFISMEMSTPWYSCGAL